MQNFAYIFLNKISDFTHPPNTKLKPSLVAPDGVTTYGRNDFTFDQQKRRILFNLDEAESGSWMLKLSNEKDQRKRRQVFNSRPTATATVYTTMKQNNNETAVLLNGQLSSNIIEDSRNDLVIRAVLRKGEDFIVNATVQAKISNPNGTLFATIDLWDNGVGADDQLHDGIYSRYFSLPLRPELRYEVSIVAKGFQDSVKLRPSGSITFDPITPEELENLEKCTQFERQIGIGSIRAAYTKYVAPIPGTITDLEVSYVDTDKRLVKLTWTYMGSVGDSGIADSLELCLTTSHTDAISRKNLTIIATSDEYQNFPSHDLDAKEGSLRPMNAGERGNVTLKIPQRIWKHSDEGQSLYFLVRSANSAQDFSNYSNVACSLRAFEFTSIKPEEPLSTLVKVLLGVFGFLGFLVATAFFAIKVKAYYYKRLAAV